MNERLRARAFDKDLFIPYKGYAFPDGSFPPDPTLRKKWVSLLNHSLMETVDRLARFRVDAHLADYLEFPWMNDFTQVHKFLPSGVNTDGTGMDEKLELLNYSFTTWFTCGQPLLTDDGYPFPQYDDFRKALWVRMEDFGITPRLVVGFLSHLLHLGSKIRSTLPDRVRDHEIAIRAATIYFNLCAALPEGLNDNRDNVYHVMMFNRALDAIKMLTRCVKRETKGAKEPRKKKGGRGGRDDDDRGRSRASVSPREDGQLTPDAAFTSQDKERIKRDCNRCIKALKRCLVWFHGIAKENVEYAVDVLMIAVRTDVSSPLKKVMGLEPTLTEKITKNAYGALEVLFQWSYIDTGEAYVTWKKEVLLVLKGCISLIHGNFYGHGNHSSKELENIRARAVTFLAESVKNWQKPLVFHHVWMICLQGLLLRAPDRTEVRRRTAEAIVKIMMAGTIETYMAFLAWVMRVGASAQKSSYRVMALDIAACLLDSPELLPKAWGESLPIGRFARAIIAVGHLPAKREAPLLRSTVDAEFQPVRKWRNRVLAEERAAEQAQLDALTATEEEEVEEESSPKGSRTRGATAKGAQPAGPSGTQRSVRRGKMNDEEMERMLNDGGAAASGSSKSKKKPSKQPPPVRRFNNEGSVAKEPFLLVFQPEAPNYVSNKPAPNQVFVMEAMLYKRLILFVMSRLQDITPSVQIRALNLLTRCLYTGSTKLVGVVRAILEDKEEDFEEVYIEHEEDKDGQESSGTPEEETVSETALRKRTHDGRVKIAKNLKKVRRRRQPEHQEGDHLVPMESMGGHEVVDALIELASDNSANMRKAALIALLHIYQMVPTMLTGEKGPSMISWRCSDESMMVRKEMIVGLNKLLTFIPEDEVLRKCWLHGIMARVKDPETAVQKKALEIVYKVFITDIVEGDYKQLVDTTSVALLRLADMTHQLHHLEYAFGQWKAQDDLKLKDLSRLVKIATSERAKDAEAEITMLCALYVRHTGCNMKLAPSLWNVAFKAVTDPWGMKLMTAIRCMEIMKDIADKLDDEKKEEAMKAIWVGLRTYRYPVNMVPTALGAWMQVHKEFYGNGAHVEDQVKGYVTRLAVRADQALLGIFAGSNYMAFLHAEADQDEDEEDPMLGENEDEDMGVEDPIYYVELSDYEDDDGLDPFLPCKPGRKPGLRGNKGSKVTDEDMPSNDKLLRMMFTVAHCCNVYPGLVNEVRLSTVLRVALFGSVDILSYPPSKDVQLGAIVVLGMMCVANSKLAHKCFRSVATHVVAKCWKVRLNSACVVASIIAKYQDLNTRNLSEIYPLLFDTKRQVRRRAVTIIVDLLQESHLKINSEQLIYMLLRCLVDEDVDVADAASFYLSNSMKKAAPKLFSQRMLGAVYFFNGLLEKLEAGGKVGGDPLMATSLDTSTVSTGGEDAVELERFDPKLKEHALPGRDQQEKRVQIYSFMLLHIDDQAKLKVAEIIAGQIIAKFAINAIEISPQNEDVLSDALRILAIQQSKEHARSDVARGDDMFPSDYDVSEGLDPRIFVDQAKKKADHVRAWDTLILESILPNVVLAHQFARTSDSYVVQDIEMFCVEMVRDYKEKATKILEKDLDLAKEVQALSKDNRRFAIPTGRPFFPERILGIDSFVQKTEESAEDFAEEEQRDREKSSSKAIQDVLDVLSDDEGESDRHPSKYLWAEIAPSKHPDRGDYLAEPLDDVLKMVERLTTNEEEGPVLPAPSTRRAEARAALKAALDKEKFVPYSQRGEMAMRTTMPPPRWAPRHRAQPGPSQNEAGRKLPTRTRMLGSPEPGSFTGFGSMEMELHRPSTSGGSRRPDEPLTVETTPRPNLSPLSLSSSSDGILPEDLPAPDPLTFSEASSMFHGLPEYTLPEGPLVSPRSLEAPSEDEVEVVEVVNVQPSGWSSPRPYNPDYIEPMVSFDGDEQINSLDRPLLQGSTLFRAEDIGQTGEQRGGGSDTFDINTVGGMVIPSMEQVEEGIVFGDGVF